MWSYGDFDQEPEHRCLLTLNDILEIIWQKFFCLVPIYQHDIQSSWIFQILLAGKYKYLYFCLKKKRSDIKEVEIQKGGWKKSNKKEGNRKKKINGNKEKVSKRIQMTKKKKTRKKKAKWKTRIIRKMSVTKKMEDKVIKKKNRRENENLQRNCNLLIGKWQSPKELRLSWQPVLWGTLS